MVQYPPIAGMEGEKGKKIQRRHQSETFSDYMARVQKLKSLPTRSNPPSLTNVKDKSKISSLNSCLQQESVSPSPDKRLVEIWSRYGFDKSPVVVRQQKRSTLGGSLITQSSSTPNSPLISRGLSKSPKFLGSRPRASTFTHSTSESTGTLSPLSDTSRGLDSLSPASPHLQEYHQEKRRRQNKQPSKQCSSVLPAIHGTSPVFCSKRSSSKSPYSSKSSRVKGRSTKKESKPKANPKLSTTVEPSAVKVNEQQSSQASVSLLSVQTTTPSIPRTHQPSNTHSLSVVPCITVRAATPLPDPMTEISEDRTDDETSSISSQPSASLAEQFAMRVELAEEFQQLSKDVENIIIENQNIRDSCIQEP